MSLIFQNFDLAQQTVALGHKALTFSDGRSRGAKETGPLYMASPYNSLTKVRTR